MYKGHNQPHFPGELGYYDLRESHVQVRQAELAKQYGIHGFCYYYYWFSGKRLLEKPLDAMRENPDVDLPYCLCWANENWTRRWDGQDKHVLMGQDYSEEDDYAFAESLISHFRDKRYIRVDGKPLLVIYRTNLFPDISGSAERWRSVWRSSGIGEVYLIRAETVGEVIEPRSIGFDAACEFPPHPYDGDEVDVEDRREGFQGQVKDYLSMMNRIRARPRPPYTLMRGVCPSWDQTPRRMRDALSYVGSSPDRYAKWLSSAIRYALDHNQPDEQIVFINAWNEWGEGAYLEPSRQFGYRHLEATAEALRDPYHEDWELQQVTAIPIDFSICASALLEQDWIDATQAFLEAFPDEVETRLFLRVTTTSERVRDFVASRLGPLVERYQGRIRSKIALLAEGQTRTFPGLVADFPNRHVPDVQEFRYWWLQALGQSLDERGIPDAERLLTLASEAFLTWDKDR
jgi:hypothetical protein